MIPEKIHYAWFGGGTKSKLIQKCIESFRMYAPEFELFEWNEASFDVSSLPFASYAAKQGKWAFVADVCRTVVLHEQGGFFLDGDNELTSGIQQFRNYEFVSGFESFEGIVHPITAFMGSEPRSNMMSYILEYYKNLENFHFEPNTSFISRYLIREKGFVPDNTLQLRDGILIAPSWYFCTPVDGKANYCIHHFNGSWV